MKDMKKMKKWLKRVMWTLLILAVVSGVLPTGIKNPVEGCGKESYNSASFWHPWGDHRQ